jgi:hypothetical protein
VPLWKTALLGEYSDFVHFILPLDILLKKLGQHFSSTPTNEVIAYIYNVIIVLSFSVLNSSKYTHIYRCVCMYILHVSYMFVLRFMIQSFTLIDKSTMLWTQRYIIKRNSFSVLYVQSSPKMKHLKTTEYFIIAIALPTRSYFSKQSATMIFCSCKSSISLETYTRFKVICLCVYVYI